MSIRARLFLAVGVPVAVLVMALAGLAWSGARVAVGQSIQHELSAVAVMAAQTVNPVTARFLLPGDEETRSYKRLVQKLAAIKQATGSSRVLLLGADEKVRADADAALPLFSDAPRVALDRAELTRALESSEASVSVPFEDEHGRRYLTAYVKVPEREGDDLVEDTAPMVLVIEAPASLLDLTDEVATYLLAVSFFAVCLVFLFAALVARTITAPVLSLASEAEALGHGRLETPLSKSSGSDEVALLGRTLEAMRKALLDRDQERQMMLAGIAHEVRNPLGGMELFSGLLEEAIAELPTTPSASGDEPWVREEARDDLASHAGRVRRELRYLTGVVNDFLAFARDLPLVRERVDVKVLLEDVRSLKAKPDAAEIGIECSVETPFALDRGRVKEALLNLVGNALQATPKEGKVTLRARKNDDGSLVLEVSDTGAGMSPEHVQRTFAPFFTTKEKGSGLGLALARKFARDHGGDATLKSELGRGTTVHILLAPEPAGMSVASDLETKKQRNKSDGEKNESVEQDEPALLG